MCIAIFTVDHPDYSVILCSNRDEVLDRPTTRAHFHNFEPLPEAEVDSSKGQVLSGRDLIAGGTWLGINRKGRIAVLTNITETPGLYRTSRGELPTDFLLPPASKFETLDDYIEHHTTPPFKSYAGFNLLLMAPLSGTPLQYQCARMTNSGGGGRLTARPLRDDERAHGAMSNGVDGAPGGEWPKVIEGRDRLSHVMNKKLDEEGLIEALFDALTFCPEPPEARQQLRTSVFIPPLLFYPTAPVPPSGTEAPQKEPLSQSTGLWYATRVSTLLLVKRDGAVTFVERLVCKLDEKGQPIRCGTDEDRVTKFNLDIS